MKKGFMAGTFHIPVETDDKLRMMAIKNHVGFSDMVIIAFKHFFSRQKEAN